MSAAAEWIEVWRRRSIDADHPQGDDTDEFDVEPNGAWARLADGPGLWAARFRQRGADSPIPSGTGELSGGPMSASPRAGTRRTASNRSRMSASFRIDPARRIVLTRLGGRVGDGDLTEHRATLTADPAFDPSFDVLVDARDITQLEVTAAGIRHLAVTDPFTGPSRRAVVVSSDAAFGLARMFQHLAARGADHMIVVRALDEATTWLGLE